MSTEQGDLPGTGSAKGPLRAQDNYPTPPVLARAGWEIARGYLGALDILDDQWSVCEPGCGDDQPFLAAAQADPRVVRLSGYDVRPVRFGFGVGADRTHLQQVDWLAPAIKDDGPWDAIITNPPFSLAEPFIRTALARVAPIGVVLMLLRMTFLGSLGRLPLWQEHPPTELSVIVPRPSFVGGGSDTNDYAFVVWAPGRGEQQITWCTWAKPGRRR